MTHQATRRRRYGSRTHELLERANRANRSADLRERIQTDHELAGHYAEPPAMRCMVCGRRLLLAVDDHDLDAWTLLHDPDQE